MNQTKLADAVKSQVREGQKMVMLENEQLRQIAVQQPRDIQKVRENCLLELQASKEFAKSAYYSIPFKDKSGERQTTTFVEGLSIKAAMMIARYFGNNANRARMIDETDDYVTVEGYFLDYESSMLTARQIVVPKNAWVKKTQTYQRMSGDRLKMAIQSGQSKAVRNAVLASVPEFIKIEVFNKSKEIAALAEKGKSQKQLLTDLLKALHQEYAVTGRDVSKLFGGKTKMKPEDVAKLQGILNALREGQTTKEETFGNKKPDAPPQQMTMQDIEKKSS